MTTEELEALRLKRIANYTKQIESIFDKAATEAASIGQLFNATDLFSKPFSFAEYPITKERIDKLMKEMSAGIQATVVNGVTAEWKNSNYRNDEIAQHILGLKPDDELHTGKFKKYFNNNDKALQAFIQRKDYGLSLSDRVWKYTEKFKSEIELGLDTGIRAGLPASEMARDLKQYLQYPDKLFRRVRDQHGNLKLSKAAAAFHPGQGVYRSSYKNAMRLTRTETNMAYRAADHARFQDWDFIVGIEVRLTNNPGHITDICDDLKGKYPKDFKFVGWHPHCYSKDTEVMTNHGWKLFKDLQPEDLIMSLNPETRQPEYVRYTEYIEYQYDGDMINFNNKTLDLLVTPDHKMVYLKKGDGTIADNKTAENYTTFMGGLYRSSEYKAEDKKTTNIGSKQIEFNLFVEFMAYYLSEGSLSWTRKNQIYIAQDKEKNKETYIRINALLEKLPFKFTPHENKFYLHDPDLFNYLKTFGKSKDKHIPEEIKTASKEQMLIFLEAYVNCDGHARKTKSFVGNHGNVFNSNKQERVYFTSSDQMAVDIGELMIKTGRRPSYSIQKTEGIKTKHKNGTYTGNKDLWRIRECYSKTATVFNKEKVPYSGIVYDVQLEKNHILYIRRNGKCVWGSNCMCHTVTILKTQAEIDADVERIMNGEPTDGASRNAVKEMPGNFKDWAKQNQERIATAKNMPYFIKDNFAGTDTSKWFIKPVEPAKVDTSKAKVDTSKPEAKPDQTKYLLSKSRAIEIQKAIQTGKIDPNDTELNYIVKVLKSYSGITSDMSVDEMIISFRSFREVELGLTKATSPELADAIRKIGDIQKLGERTVQPIYRGTPRMNIIGSENRKFAPLEAPKVGDTINMDATTSYTKSFKVAQEFSIGGNAANPQKAWQSNIYEIRPGARGIDVSKISNWKNQQEVLTSGKFRVVEVKERIPGEGFKLKVAKPIKGYHIILEPIEDNTTSIRTAKAIKTAEQKKAIQEAWNERKIINRRKQIAEMAEKRHAKRVLGQKMVIQERWDYRKLLNARKRNLKIAEKRHAARTKLDAFKTQAKWDERTRKLIDINTPVEKVAISKYNLENFRSAYKNRLDTKLSPDQAWDMIAEANRNRLRITPEFITKAKTAGIDAAEIDRLIRIAKMPTSTADSFNWRISEMEHQIEKYEKKIASVPKQKITPAAKAAIQKSQVDIPVELRDGGIYFNGTNIKINEEIFKLLDEKRPVQLVIHKTDGSQFSPNSMQVRLQNGTRQAKSAWEREAVVYHEYGHAIDHQRGLRWNNDTRDIMSKWKVKMAEKVEYTKSVKLWDYDTQKYVTITKTVKAPLAAQITDRITNICLKCQRMDEKLFLAKGVTKADMIEQLSSLADTIKSLNIRYGGGHTTEYFKIPGFSQAEFIAHAFENKFIGNYIFKKLAPELYQDMIDYINILKP